MPIERSMVWRWGDSSSANTGKTRFERTGKAGARRTASQMPAKQPARKN